jgi:3-phosphoshikimate 1-carboxyvinyltransferase
MLPAFGVHVDVHETAVAIAGGQELHACDVAVPGDLSSAAFFIGAALMIPGSELYIRGVGLNPTRTGVLDVFRIMGGTIMPLNEREVCGEPIGDLLVRSSPLKGVAFTEELVVRAIDEIPIVAMAAAAAQGATTIRGAQELRVKESDRIHALAVGLAALGIRVSELSDGLIIEGGSIGGGRVQSFDHRIAMYCW